MLSTLAMLVALGVPCNICFYGPDNMIFDRAGNVYVAQALPKTVEEFSADGLLKAYWDRPRGMNANQWTGPESIAVQSGGALVVEDWGSRRIEILGSRGETIAIFGQLGKGHGKFVNTAGVAVDSNDDIYVADVGTHCVQKFDPRGRWLSSICNAPSHALFEVGPSSVAVDAKGNLYSADGLSVVKYAQDGTLLARWV